jgi:hypothetical protein
MKTGVSEMHDIMVGARLNYESWSSNGCTLSRRRVLIATFGCDAPARCGAFAAGVHGVGHWRHLRAHRHLPPRTARALRRVRPMTAPQRVSVASSNSAGSRG